MTQQSNLPGPRPVPPVEKTMLAMPYGVHVIGSRSAEGAFNLMLADWVMQVSFKPRLVAVAIENDARTLRFIRETKRFSVNLLHGSDGAEIARRVVMPAEGSKVRGRTGEEATKIHDKLAGIGHVLHECGVPVLTHCLGWFTCEAQQFVAAGDHTVVIGQVSDGAVIRTGDALTEKELGWEYAG